MQYNCRLTQTPQKSTKTILLSASTIDCLNSISVLEKLCNVHLLQGLFCSPRLMIQGHDVTRVMCKAATCLSIRGGLNWHRHKERLFWFVIKLSEFECPMRQAGLFFFFEFCYLKLINGLEVIWSCGWAVRSIGTFCWPFLKFLFRFKQFCFLNS